ncbi:hypothetical protein K438DRAFT_1768426 [Mycena galopus ATCC 62051]|nr:hypothetical protein K438DRAFT_1768426 [Mycena galopus ATCC 62051]
MASRPLQVAKSRVLSRLGRGNWSRFPSKTQVLDHTRQQIQTKLSPESGSRAILLSDKIASYKGECLTTSLMEVIKRLQSIPKGWKDIPADWGKVISYSEYSLTQRCSKIKRVVRLSLQPQKDEAKKTITYAKDSKHYNIFDTTAIFKGTQYKSFEISYSVLIYTGGHWSDESQLANPDFV